MRIALRAHCRVRLDRANVGAVRREEHCGRARPRTNVRDDEPARIAESLEDDIADLRRVTRAPGVVHAR